MPNKIIIEDPELGELDAENEKEVSDAIKEIEEQMQQVTQKVSSGVEMDNIRKFKDAVDRGDKKLAQKAIDETDEPTIKASMERLMKFL